MSIDSRESLQNIHKFSRGLGLAPFKKIASAIPTIRGAGGYPPDQRGLHDLYKDTGFRAGGLPQLGALCEISYPLFISHMGVWGLAPKYKKSSALPLTRRRSCVIILVIGGVILCQYQITREKRQKNGSRRIMRRSALSILKGLGMCGKTKPKSGGCLLLNWFFWLLLSISRGREKCAALRRICRAFFFFLIVLI